MAQTVKFPGVSKRIPADVAHKRLEVEKASVIAGFLLGLVLAFGPVRDMLNAVEAPDFVSGLGIVLTIAVVARAGLVVGVKLASLIGVRR